MEKQFIFLRICVLREVNKHDRGLEGGREEGREGGSVSEEGRKMGGWMGRGVRGVRMCHLSLSFCPVFGTRAAH